MLTKTLALSAVLIMAIISLAAQSQSRGNSKTNNPSSESIQNEWPNLDRLTKFKNPKGTTCGLDGAAPRGSEKARINRLRNRYHLPANGFENFTLKDLLALPQDEISPEKVLINYRASDENNRAVTFIGYVKDVMILGCGASTLPPDIRVRAVIPHNRGIESCNCYTNEALLCSTQIILSPGPDVSIQDGHNLYVVQVTERSRRLARLGLLSSNIGNNWSIDALRALKDHWVRFSGWLFFNPNYRERAWISDPDNKKGKPNVRQTAWEIYPVMAIEAKVTPPV